VAAWTAVGADGPMERGLRPRGQQPAAARAPPVGADGPMERGLRRVCGVPGVGTKRVGADGPMERGLRPTSGRRSECSLPRSAPTARWKGDCDKGCWAHPSSLPPRRRRRPDEKGLRLATTLDEPRATGVGADGPMERGLRRGELSAREGHRRSAPTARWKGDCDSAWCHGPVHGGQVGADGPMERGLRHPAAHSSAAFSLSGRRRRPDGKGIATGAAFPRASRRPGVGADGPMERGLRPRKSTLGSFMVHPTSAPTARWKGDCDVRD